MTLKGFDMSSTYVINSLALANNLSAFVKIHAGVSTTFNISVDDTKRTEKPLNNPVSVESGDFSEQMQPRMFKFLKFHDFGSSFDTKDDGTEVLELNLHYRFENFTMGENGTLMAQLVFDMNGDIVDYELASQK